MIKAEKVKISQLALILLIVIPGGKYLSLPSYMYSISGRDSWLSFLLLFVLDFVCFLFTLWAINLNRRGLSLNEILTRTLSPVGAKIIFAVFTVFCLLRVTVLLLGCVDLFSSTFVINTNWLAYIIPIALLVAVSLGPKRGAPDRNAICFRHAGAAFDNFSLSALGGFFQSQTVSRRGV